MDVITESSEHHFLTMLEKVKRDPSDWMALYFSLSRKLSHAHLIKNPSGIKAEIQKSRKEAQAFINELSGKVDGYKEKYLYMFADHDVILLARLRTKEEQEHSQKLFSDMAGNLRADYSDYGILENELYNYQKLADHKLLTNKRYEAYEAMSDTHRVKSVAVRRKRRDHALVMVVEDDRFTAAYAANILNKDYDLVLCRSGEEAVAAYIENAPDIVLLDIHLPGMNGNEVLQCIRAVDEKACVWMLSVDTVKNTIVQANEIGAQGFIKKPFSKDRLLNTVKQSPFVRSHNTSYSGDTLFH